MSLKTAGQLKLSSTSTLYKRSRTSVQSRGLTVSSRRSTLRISGSLAIGAETQTKSSRRTKLRIRIDNQWYDCTGWALAHPAGAQFIHLFDGRDATDVFYAIHSNGHNGDDEAVRRLAKLPKCEAPEDAVLPEKVTPKVAANCVSFRDLRMKLEEDGWFERNMFQEIKHIAQVVLPIVAGTVLAHTQPIAAMLLIALGMQQGGWLAHDYCHGRGKWCIFWKYTGSLFNGFSQGWWSHKHSLHHAFTNQHGVDGDCTMEPFFYLQEPEETGAADSPIRKYQHIYGYPLYGATYYLWRFDSFRHAVATRNWVELGLIAANFAWLCYLGPLVALSSILVGGFMVGALVSATHQSEEMLAEQGEFVDQQFRTTRDAEVKNPFLRFLWGGMDTQLEHHLFPSMPRYNYHKLRPILKAFADEHDMGYRISPDHQIISDNYNTLKTNANVSVLETIMHP